MRHHDFTTGPIFRPLLTFMLPVMVTLFLQALTVPSTFSRLLQVPDEAFSATLDYLYICMAYFFYLKRKQAGKIC